MFSQKGHRVSLIILDETTESFYPLNQNISVVQLQLNFGIGGGGNFITRKLAFFTGINSLKKKLQNLSPDFIVTTEYVFTVAAYYGRNENAKLASWEHHHFYHLPKSKLWKFLSAKVYPRTDKVICLNVEEASFFERINCKTTVIPNFVDDSTRAAPLTEKRLLTIGWLSKTKGADLIPKIAASVFKRHPDWRWRIIGEGSELSSLQEQPNIEVVKPSSPSIVNEYLNASVYVLPSRYECFPLVLLESMSVGVPCVAFNCPTGPKHIITDGIDGLLVEKENVEAMAHAIIGLIEDKERRMQLGSNASENIKRFSAESSFQLWQKWFETNF